MSSYAPAAVRILIADDHPVTREGIASLLLRQEGVSIVGVAQNGKEAVELFRQHRPDVLLMDVHMPQMNGLEALTAIRGEFPQARIIMLSTFDAQDDIYQAIRGGAKSYLLKDAAPADLRQTITEVAEGRTCLSPHVTDMLTQRMRMPELTARETEILGCLSQGRSNQEIASALFIAEGTVKVHISNILGKLGVSDRTQAVTSAVKRGLVHL